MAAAGRFRRWRAKPSRAGCFAAQVRCRAGRLQQRRIALSTRFEIKAARLAEDVHLGGYTFARPFVEINPAFPLANFGSCPMQDFALTFDQKDGLIRFDARQRSIHLAATPVPLRL